MATQRKYEIADFKEAILKAGASAKLIASYLGCTRSTVYSYLRKYPELKAVYEAHKGTAIAEGGRFTKEQVELALHESRGVKASAAARLGCSRQTVDNYLEKWPELAETMDAARAGLIDQAVSALVNDITNRESDGHQRAYMFALRTLGKDEGFSERTEVTGADGEALFDLPPDVVKLIKTMGLDMSEVTKHLAGMVRAMAQQKGLLGDG